MPRRLTLFAALLSLVMVLTACGVSTTTPAAAPQPAATPQPAAPPAPVTVKVGLVCNLTALQLHIAMNGGFFTKNNITVEKTCFDGGAKGAQALVAKAIDIMSGTYEHVQKLRAQGEDVVAVAGLLNRVGYQLLALKDNSANAITDMKGKKAGITSAGSLTDMTLRADLKASGMDPTKDVQIIPAGSGSTMIAALENKQIDAGMVAEPFLTEMLNTGKYKVVFDHMTYEYAGIVLMVRGEWAAANADTLKRVLAAIHEGRAAAEKDPSVAVKAAQLAFPTITPATVDTAVKRLLPFAQTDLKITASGAAKVIEHLKSIDALPKEVPFAESFVTTYLPK